MVNNKVHAAIVLHGSTGMTQSGKVRLLILMRVPYELLIGWRYTRAGRSTRRNGFISFISGVSMLGIALGVAALIIVLSVMNGFQKEVRDRMLGVVSHVEVYAAGGQALPDLALTLQQARSHPQVVGAAPFIAAQALLARGEDMKGVMVRGIDPALEHEVTDLAGGAQAAVLERLVPGEFGVVLGSELARALGVRTGDRVTLVAPSGQVTPAGVVPRLKQMTVVGTFSSGHFEYDSTLVMLHIDDAQRLFRVEGPTGVRVKLKDMNQARTVRLPVHVIRELNQVLRAKRHLEKGGTDGRDASLEDIAHLLGKTPDEVQDVLALNEHTTSLDTPFDLDPGSSLLDFLSDEHNAAPDQEVAHRELENLMKQWLARLSEKHRYVVERRFGLNHIEPATLEELAEEMGLIRERVRQIERHAITKLRDKSLAA